MKTIQLESDEKYNNLHRLHSCFKHSGCPKKHADQVTVS